MLEVQRSDFLREGEACNPPTDDLLPPDTSGASVSGWKPAERTVSFNRDVHVKRIGRGAPRVTAALAGDGEGRLIATPVHKESIASRSKEDLAQEAALVLQQAGSLHCVAQDNRRLPGRFSTLPARRNKKRPELPLDVRRRSEEIGSTTSGDLVGTPRPKKKALERSASDAGSKKLKKGALAKLFSPKLERKRKPVGRSASDAGTATRSHRKRSGSDSEGSHLSSVRAKKQLSPIIEASPHVDQPPFHFGRVAVNENASVPGAKKSKQEEFDAVETVREIGESFEGTEASKPPISPRRANKSTVRRIPIVLEDDNKIGEEGAERKEKVTRTPSPAKDTGLDEVDKVGASSMLHSSRYDLQQRDEESTIHKMIHRLSNDRSPPPQLTRTMVSPGPGFGHNNNRPFSYTRPNESCSPPPPQTNVIYAQVQTDKKKAQRSHSDSDEGLGLERKDSSRENSPAEKEYRRTDYSYSSDLRRNNEINAFKNVAAHFPGHYAGTQDYASRNTEAKRRHEFDEIDRRLYDKPEKYTSTVFVDTSGRSRADGTDARQPKSGISNKTSELSARRDLLESRIKLRLQADEMFAAKNTANVPIKKSEHEIIDKPIVPSPVTPNRVASPKRYMDTYITETRTNSNGEKYIFEKEIHEDNGKVYGYEKKITNKIPNDGYIDTKPRDGYKVETRTDKYGDKYIVETRTHEGYADDFKPFLSDRSRTSPDERFQAVGNTSTPYKVSNFHPVETPVGHRYRGESKENHRHVLSSPIIAKKLANERKFSKSDDFLDRDARPRDAYAPLKKKNLESIRGMSKSTQRLDEIGENARVRALRSEYTTRSHENLTSRADYVNARDMRRPLMNSPTINGRKERSPFAKRHLDSLREGPNDDYDTDISQLTSSQLESKYYKETRTTQRYTSSKHPAHDDYDSSPPRIRTDRGGYNSSRYDSDTTARDSIRCETRNDESSRTLRKEHRKLDEDPKKPLRRSRNRLDYFDDSDARESPRAKASVGRLEPFDESPTRPPRAFHEGGKSRHIRQETRAHTERRHRETRLSDSDRKDRLADSGIENDYRRDSQEVDRREQIESEDEGFVTRQFIKHERRHTDRNMNLTPSEQRKYDKYTNDVAKSAPVTAKPPSGADKKYEKKAAKKSGTMSKVKQLFSKKEKKTKEEKNKKNARSSSSGALTDDEVTMRYREYRGDQLRSAKSARDLGSDINQEEYSQRRRLSTPSGSPSPPRPTRLSRSTGTLTRDEETFCESSNTLTRENQGQEAERKGWFKSLSRKNKSNIKAVDKKPRIPESEILTTGTEDEEVSSAPERVSVQKNLRFFGDTDQESVSSNRDRRNKRADDHACSGRDVTNSSRHNLGILSPPRKPPRLAESALSSGESTTGDSSQQSQNSQRSQRSVVYLHAATVGEIPGPNERRRAASREELNRPLQSHTRTVSRSVSVLAPWKPRHYREPFEINYDQQLHPKPMATIRRRQRSRETLSRRGKDARRSKDNLSKTGTINRSTLKSKDKQKVDRTVSTESLATKSRSVNSKPELSRSTSVPRDPNKSAGWFKLKSKKSRA
ncbi:zinc finger CCCH domain-containing protein 13 [Colletes gigas]|uniref:zinc finger CCCH domain-containing protein 13 n=1 Tax=Colletes gigas TaxID=935657 RepID=UPI001C9A8523|nr:zinc finger CCCH domain-containing protein 13 [Colletes gigas]XP_043256039.1 zinc finger CCCH domain-containing protein 13 [Colletes gigas]